MSTRGERWGAIDQAVARVRPLFWVISPRDFTVAIRWAHTERNGVRDQIRQKILDMRLGKSESGTISKEEPGL